MFQLRHRTMRVLPHVSLIGDKCTLIRSTPYQLCDNSYRWCLFTVGSIIKMLQLLFTLLVIRTLNADALTWISFMQPTLPFHLFHCLQTNPFRKKWSYNAHIYSHIFDSLLQCIIQLITWHTYMSQLWGVCISTCMALWLRTNHGSNI